MPKEIPLLRDILLRTTARYLNFRPHGFEFPDGAIKGSISCRILAYGGARTLYRGRKPHCRSLDGSKALDGSPCDECLERKHCTPQVRLDLLHRGSPYRLLLAYSSAKNFLLFARGQPAASLEMREIRIAVIDRGTWGELRFSEVPSQ